MIVELYRHGATPSNLQHRYLGLRDEPLDAGWAAGAVPIDDRETHVFVTRLVRTQQTARLLFPRAGQTVVEGLEEMDFGAFDGRAAHEMTDDPAYQAWLDSWCEKPCPGGEDRATFERRCSGAFDRLVRDALAAGTRRMRLVVHGGTIMSVMHSFADPPVGFFDCPTAPGGRWTVHVDEGSWARRTLTVMDGPVGAGGAGPSAVPSDGDPSGTKGGGRP